MSMWPGSSAPGARCGPVRTRWPPSPTPFSGTARRPVRTRRGGVTCLAGPPTTICSPTRSVSVPPRTISATRISTAEPDAPWTRGCWAPRCWPSGPCGSGKTTRVVKPVVESMCLQALAGQSAVIVVGPAGSDLGPDDAFDVVVRVGRPDPDCDLDLYGGTTDPDEASGILAEALVGDLAEQLPGGDSRRAATTLAQLLGPFRAAHDRFPTVPELRELLDGAPRAMSALRTALQDSRRPPCCANWTPARASRSVPAMSGCSSPTASRSWTGPPSPPSSIPRAAPARSRCAPSTIRCGSESNCPSAAMRKRRGSSPGWYWRSSPSVRWAVATARCSPVWCSTRPPTRSRRRRCADCSGCARRTPERC